MNFDQAILDKMSTFDEFEGVDRELIKKRIIRGYEIYNEDKRIRQANRVIRSHYHLSDEDNESMSTAATYRIMKGD